MKNKLLKGGHLSEKKCREILQLFSEDLTATEIADISGVSRVTVNNYFKLLRTIIASYSDAGYSPVTTLGSLQDNDNAPEPTEGNTGCFGLTQHDNKVYSQWLKTVCHNSVKKILKEGDDLARLYTGLSQFHAISECADWELLWVARGKDATHGSKAEIAGFWSYTKSRLQKFRGLNKNTLYLHIKECEFRYNARNGDVLTSLNQAIDWKYKNKNTFSIKAPASYAGLLS